MFKITFEDKEVVALFNSSSLSDKSTGVDICVNISAAFKAAFWNDSDIVVGWIPFSNNRCAAASKLPAITTTDVVPSPASTSCAFDNSTSCKTKYKCISVTCVSVWIFNAV